MGREEDRRIFIDRLGAIVKDRKNKWPTAAPDRRAGVTAEVRCDVHRQSGSGRSRENPRVCLRKKIGPLARNGIKSSGRLVVKIQV